MKHFKSIIIGLIFCCVFFGGCQYENVDFNEKSTDLTTGTAVVSIDEMLNIVKDTDIKKSILDNKRVKKSSQSENINFEKINMDDYDNYSLFINDYSPETPYYNFFIITIDKQNVEKAFYVKYIPIETPTEPFVIKRFKGSVEISDINHEIKSTISLSYGSTIEVIVTEECTTFTYISEITCSNGGNHGIGQLCEKGFVNDAYIQVTTTTECHNVYSIVFVAGGGGSAPPSTSQNFYNNLNNEQKAFLNANPDVKSSIYIYLEKTTDTDANTFAIEMVNMLKDHFDHYGQIGIEELNALRMTREAKLKGYFTNPFDQNYYNLIDTYTEVNLSGPEYAIWAAHFSAQCAILKFQNPDWSMCKVYWEASKEMIHLGLDVIGLVPVIGEVADLTNGVIYTIEGDGLNATLSYASAIPFVGWTASGVKFAKRVINITDTSKTTLKWFVKANDIIIFGDRGQLRKVLNLTDTAKQAHHIIPWGKSSHIVVQRAAQSHNYFHMNDALNGIAVANWRNQPNHNLYDNKIVANLDDFIDANPNATPDQCYSALMEIIDDAKQAIINNPNVHLNNLIF